MATCYQQRRLSTRLRPLEQQQARHVMTPARASTAIPFGDGR
jgi:hypothetical protein